MTLIYRYRGKILEKVEFKKIVVLYESYWGVEFNNLKLDIWYEQFKVCNYFDLEIAIKNLASTEDYPPKIATMISKYREIHNNRLEEQKKARQHDALALIDRQNQESDCKLCKGNKGYITYYKNLKGDKLSHEYTDECCYLIFSRCECAYGSNPFVFGRSQTDKDYCNRLNAKNLAEGKKERFMYYLTFREAVGDEFYKDRQLLIKEKQFEKSNDIDFNDVQLQFVIKKDIQSSLPTSEYPRTKEQ